MLEMNVELVHAGWVVHVCHDLVEWDPHLVLDLLACLGVERDEHWDVLAAEVSERPQRGVRGYGQPVEGAWGLSTAPAAFDGLQPFAATGRWHPWGRAVPVMLPKWNTVSLLCGLCRILGRAWPPPVRWAIEQQAAEHLIGDGVHIWEEDKVFRAEFDALCLALGA